MLIEKFLTEFKIQFDQKLFKFLGQKEKQAGLIDKNFQEAIREIKRITQAGGKRLRPAFVYLGYQAGCGLIKSPALKEKPGFIDLSFWNACLAVELIQIFAIIHDDIMDNASLRRGEITTFKKLGLNKAILAGDLVLCLADSLIPVKAKHLFDLLKFEVCAGQYLDIDQNPNAKIKNQNENLKFKILEKKEIKAPRGWPNGLPWVFSQGLPRGGGINEEQVYKIMKLKSASYSVIRPLQIGGVLGGASQKTLAKLYNFGLNLGLAFQIKDDILGVFGMEKEIGKPVGSDISEGKRTLLIAKFFKNQKSPAERDLALREKLKTFLRLFGSKKQLNNKELVFIQDLFKEAGVLGECEREMERLITKAQKEIENARINKEIKKILLGMGNFLIKRNY